MPITVSQGAPAFGGGLQFAPATIAIPVEPHPHHNPALSLQNQQAFGVITSTYTPPDRTNRARWIEFGLRLEF